MLPTYPAILRNGTLEWENGNSPSLPSGAVPVYVTILAPPSSATGGPAMAAALEAIAAMGGPSGFGDPAEWQRETRADRPLPGRDA